MKYLLAHDIGTSGNKATVFSEDGQLIKSCTEPYGCNYFNTVCAEQDPDDWWNAVVVSTKKILQIVPAKDIAAVSFSGQMMGCLCVDKLGRPLHPAVIWADTRAAEEADQLATQISHERFFRLTGAQNSPSFAIQKLAWIKNNIPDIYKKTYKMVSAKDYIILRLTGIIATDYSDAAGTGAFNISKFEWSDEIIDALGLSKDKFADVYPSIHVAGGVTAEAAALTGLLQGTPVVMGGGDASCAAVGAGCVEEGDAYCILGTSSWVSFAKKTPYFDEKMQITNWPSLIPGWFNPNGTMQAAGVAYEWMKDTMCEGEVMRAKAEGGSVYELINKQIVDAPAGCRGLMFLPYLLGERAPRWNPNARACFIGLKKEHTHGEICRSVLEGVIFNLNAILDIYKKVQDISKLTVIGGGSKSPEWRQMMADIFNADIIVPNYLQEATSMGAAVTAGVGVGLFQNFSVIHDFLKTESVVQPIPENVEQYKKMIPLYDKAYFALEDLYADLACI